MKGSFEIYKEKLEITSALMNERRKVARGAEDSDDPSDEIVSLSITNFLSLPQKPIINLFRANGGDKTAFMSIEHRAMRSRGGRLRA